MYWQRPDIQTSSLLQIFADREEGQALYKLAMTELPGEPQTWQTVFNDALAQLTRQANQQRLEQLQKRMQEVKLSAQEINDLQHLLIWRAQDGKGG